MSKPQFDASFESNSEFNATMNEERAGFTAELSETPRGFSAVLDEFATTYETLFEDFIIMFRGIEAVWIGDGTNNQKEGFLYAQLGQDVTEIGPVSGFYYAKQNGFEGSYLDWVQTILDATTHAENAELWATGSTGGTYQEGDSAKEQANRAATWAVGSSTGDGSSTNNAKYWAEQSKIYTDGKDFNDNTVVGKEQVNAKYWAETAASSADEAQSVYDEFATDSGNYKDNLILVQSTRPTNENNKIWVKTSETALIIPSYTEFSELANKVTCSETDNGTYVLKCVISNGTKTYVWVAET